MPLYYLCARFTPDNSQLLRAWRGQLALIVLGSVLLLAWSSPLRCSKGGVLQSLQECNDAPMVNATVLQWLHHKVYLDSRFGTTLYSLQASFRCEWLCGRRLTWRPFLGQLTHKVCQFATVQIVNAREGCSFALSVAGCSQVLPEVVLCLLAQTVCRHCRLYLRHACFGCKG